MPTTYGKHAPPQRVGSNRFNRRLRELHELQEHFERRLPVGPFLSTTDSEFRANPLRPRWRPLVCHEARRPHQSVATNVSLCRGAHLLVIEGFAPAALGEPAE